tara:strand:- start:347 stop:2914 length:2568 start_codon:yes stop_codon:yes gene_type:complete
MISNDLNRAEFTSNGSSTNYVFQNSDASIQVKVKDQSHIKVYVTTTGNFTANSSTNVFTHNAHGHLDGEIVTLKAGTSLPIGLKSGTDYYVRDKTTNTFKLEASIGGGAISISDTGSGTLTWTKTSLKTLDTDYSVAISTSDVATVTWLSGKIPANEVKFFFLREVPYTQTIDLLNNSLIEAESLENQLDLIVNQTQQLNAKTDRDLRFHDNLLSTDATESQASLNVTATDRANKSLKFDAQGSLSVTSVNVDDAEDYVLEAKSYATESGAVVNHFSSGVASPQSNVYSAREHAVGSATPSSKDYATKTSAAVTGSEFSSKEYAQGTQASTGGSSKNWASQTGADVTGGSSGDKSSKSWAIETGGTAPAGGSAKEWATETSAAVDTTFSSKEYAQGSQSGTGGSSKNWASQTGADVTGGSTGDMSSKEWAVGTLGRGVASEGSAKDWATYTAGTVDDAGYSAKYHATDASNSATAAKNSAAAVANSFDSFDDTYLGRMADNPSFTASSDSGLLITSNGHGLVDTQIIRVANTGGALPGNLSASTNYFVRDKTTNTFKLATSSGGTAIAHSSNGSGTNTWYHGDVVTPTSSSWAKNSSTITVASNIGIRVGQVVSGTGIPTSPKPNVLSIDSTSIVISENMTAAGSSKAVTFASRGVYGQYNSTTKGPTTNNDGDTLETGSLYFNSTANEMRILDSGSNWIAATSAGDVSLLEYKFVTTSSQVTSKTYSGAADVGGTLSYTASNIIVFMNGVQLKNGVDYTATNGSSIVLTTAGQLLDEINVLAFKSFTTADMVSKSNGGTFASAVTFGAGLTSTTGTFSGAITANGGIETSTTTKVKQKGAFMQHSTHQAWVMGG